MKSLFTRLLLAHLIVLLLAFGLLGLLLHQVIYPSYLQMISRQLEARGVALGARVLPLLEKKEWPALNKHMEFAKASLGAEICLVSNGGDVLAHAVPANQQQWQDEPPISDCCSDFTQRGPVVEIKDAAQTRCRLDMIVAKIPLWPNGADSTASPEPLGTLLIRAPISEINNVSQRLGWIILLCGIAGVILAQITATLLSSRIAGPLSNMRSMAASIAEGDFAARLQIRGQDEVAQLGVSFNTMADRLKQSLAQLEDESAKLRGVLSSMAEGIVAIDANQVIILANPQTFGVLNLPQRELVGKKLTGAELPQHLVSAFQQCLAECRMVSEQHSFATDQDQTGVAEIHVVPMRLGQEEWGAVAIVLDVSEAHRLEGMRRRFFSDISHELRTPLTNITGYASALEDGVAADEASRQRAVSVILKESERLRRFIEDLLDLSRLQSGEPNLQKEWCELGPIAESAAESLEGLAQQAKVTLHVELPAELPKLLADPDRISQVFVNLISNAIHFNRPGGEVLVSACPEENEIRILVRDTGVGIPAEELPYVWERFHRAANTPENVELKRAGAGELRTNGSGIGLTIVRSIVRAHAGRVWVDSAPEQGATFGFSLPLRP